MLKISQKNIREVSTSQGIFYRYCPDKEYNFAKIPLKFSYDEAACVYRSNSCFMRVKQIRRGELPPDETQYILAREKGLYRLIYALSDGDVRTCFKSENGKVYAVLDSFSDKTTSGETDFIYTVCGKEPYGLFKRGAADLAARFSNLRLKENKTIPEFVKYLGFCTYNAFYTDFDEQKLEDLLALFDEHNQKLGFLLIDSGWQSISDLRYMSDFAADEAKFPGGLRSFSDKIRTRFGVRYLLLWHVFIGYWAGVKGFEKYEQKETIFSSGNGADDGEKEDVHDTMGEFYPSNLAGIRIRYVDNDIRQFYDDFYRYLSECGVDGCKVDAFGWAELIGRRYGGGIDMTRRYAKAMADAADKHFGGNLISCSCNGNGYLFNSFSNSVTRNTEDYQPSVKESHGNHILFNAHNVLWLGEFFNCDFDMFQSGRFAGEFHAKNRAVSGGPVYVTDEPEKIRFDIIQSICTHDGRVPSMDDYPRLTQDSLFTDPVRDRKLLKQFNRKGDALVLAIFNCLTEETLEGSYRLSDISGVREGVRYVSYSSDRGFLGVIEDPFKEYEITLSPVGAELITFLPVVNGKATIGLKGKYLPNAFVETVGEKERLLEPGIIMRYSDKNGFYEEISK